MKGDFSEERAQQGFLCCDRPCPLAKAIPELITIC